MVLSPVPRVHCRIFPGARTPAPHAQPSPRRVAAWSVALAVHALVAVLMLSPATRIELPAAPAPKPRIDTIWIDAVLPSPPPVVPEPLRREEPRPVAPSPVDVLPAPEIVRPVVEASSATVASPAKDPPGEPNHAPAIPTRQAIAVDTVTPPPYPRIAARRGHEGTVLLRVLIGTDGRPREVRIEQGSGHGELDHAARRHVLAAWRFHPALQDGEPVQAWVRVPIEFALR